MIRKSTMERSRGLLSSMEDRKSPQKQMMFQMVKYVLPKKHTPKETSWKIVSKIIPLVRIYLSKGAYTLNDIGTSAFVNNQKL